MGVKHVDHHTVDGRNPAPVDTANIPVFTGLVFTGFYTSQVVVWDFFHQQYPRFSKYFRMFHPSKYPSVDTLFDAQKGAFKITGCPLATSHFQNIREVEPCHP